MSRALRAITPRKPQKRAPRGTDIGGQWISKSSVMHALVKLFGTPKSSEHLLTNDPLMKVGRPKLLAVARDRGVKVPRGAAQRDIVANIQVKRAKPKGPVTAALGGMGREDLRKMAKRKGIALERGEGRTDIARKVGVPGVETAVAARAAGAAAQKPHLAIHGHEGPSFSGPVGPKTMGRVLSRAGKRLGTDDRVARHLLKNWKLVGGMHGLDQLRLMENQPPGVLERVAKARGVKPGSRGLVWPLVMDASKLRGSGPIRTHGDVPDELHPLMPAPGQAKASKALSALAKAMFPSDSNRHGFAGPSKSPTRRPSARMRMAGAVPPGMSVTPAPGAVPLTKNPMRRALAGAVRVEGKIQQWMAGGGSSDPFKGFGRNPMRQAAKNRGLVVPRGAGRATIGRLLLDDARGKTRARRSGLAVATSGNFHRDFNDPDIAALRASVRKGERSRRSLGGGFMGDTVQVTFKDGTKAVRKVSVRDMAGMDAVHQADAEQLGALLGRAMGANIPAVFRHDQKTILMAWVDGRQAEDVLPNARHPGAAMLKANRILGLFDLVTDNRDRHGRNFMIDSKGNAIGIDHGLLWPPDEVNQVPSPAPQPMGFARLGGSVSPFAEPFVAPGGHRWADNDMTKAELAEIRVKMEATRPDFEKLGRAAWLDFALARLDAIAAHAKGGAARKRGAGAPAGPAAQLRAVARGGAGAHTLIYAIDQAVAGVHDQGERRKILNGLNMAQLRRVLADAGFPMWRSSRMRKDQLVDQLLQLV